MYSKEYEPIALGNRKSKKEFVVMKV
jgi:hypothetical protein